MNHLLNSQEISISDYRNVINFVANNNSSVRIFPNHYAVFQIGKNVGVIPSEMQNFIKAAFNGRSVQIPFFAKSQENKQYLNFEDFTSRDEVGNLSLWAISVLKYLSYDTSIRLGRELEITLVDYPRNGRLDVVAFTNETLLIFEAKKDLASLMKEDRYRYQIPAYLKECESIVKKYNKENSSKVSIQVILLIGGDESNIYPLNHPDCTTGQIGSITQLFYNSLIEYKIQFMTANALWCISAQSDVFNKKINWERLLHIIYDDKSNLGLLSGGVARFINGSIQIVPLNLLVDS